MYKKLYIYIFFYSLFVTPLFAFSIEAGEDQNITLEEVATLEATVSSDVNSDELVWKINNETYAIGETFYFYPTETGTYPIQLFYQGNEEDNLTVNVTNALDTETSISKFSVNNKCMQVKIVSGKGHSPSYIYLKVEEQPEQLLATEDSEYGGRFHTINSPKIIALQDGGYSVFWLVYSQMRDEALRMSRFDSNGNIVVNNKLLETFDPAGSNVTITQLSNQNYIVSQCRVYRSLRIRVYDYTSNSKLYELHPSLSPSRPCNRHEKTKIMPISNNTFVFSADNQLWHFDNQGNEIPFN